MKLEKINISNFLGAKSVAIHAQQNVQLFCGPNAAGKSSIRDAVSLALTADLGRVSLKKEAGQLVSEGAKAATCEVITSDGDAYTVVISDSGKITDSRSKTGTDPVLPYVLDAQRFTSLSTNDRRTFLMGLMNVQTDPATIKARLLERKHDQAKVERITPMLRAGFDAAHKDAKAKATEARGAWRAITGENYGSEKAKTWRAEVPKVNAAKIKELQTELQHIDVATSSWQQQIGALNAEQKRRQELAAKLPALREHAGRIDRIEKKLATDEADLADWARKVSDAEGSTKSQDALECPCCKAMLVRVVDALVEAGPLAKGTQEDVDQLPTYRHSRDLLSKAVANDKRDLEAAKKAQTDIEAIEPELAQEFDSATLDAARQQIDSLQAKRQEINKELDTQQSLKLQAEAADRKTKEAAAHAEDVAQWDELADALAPDGLPAEILAQTLSPINERLAQSAADTNWPVAVISADMAITGAGRDYHLLSESERWRIDAMVAEAIAYLSGMRLLVLDRFDVLEPAARGVLLGWLDVLADLGELDTALVFGTLKAAPDANNLPPSVEAHWVSNGSITTPQPLKAAA